MARNLKIDVIFSFPIGEIKKAINRAADRAVTATVIETQARLTETLSKPGTGRVYKRKSGTHRASRRGRPPAADTGMLRLSFTTGMRVERRTTEKTVDAKMKQGVNFGSALKYAPILEDPERLNRPYLAPTVRQMKRDRVLKDFMSRALLQEEPFINALVK